MKLDKDENGKEVDITKYRGMIGSLLYLTAIGPDIMSMFAYVLDFNQILRNLILVQ